MMASWQLGCLTVIALAIVGMVALWVYMAHTTP